MNLHIVKGNITKDPVKTYTTNGMACVKFSVAVNDSYKDKDGNWQKSVDYINVISWGKQAEVISEHFHSGSSILLTGKVKTSSWEKDGKKHYKTETKLDTFEFVDRKSGSDQSVENQQTVPQQSGDGDLPF